MSTTLPVLFLDDAVVLPGMVLPLELTDQAQASIDAARAARGSGRSTDLHDQTRDQTREPLRLLLVPRLDGRSGVMGTVAEVSQIGRLPAASPPLSCARPLVPGSAPAFPAPARRCGSRPRSSTSPLPPAGTASSPPSTSTS